MKKTLALAAALSLSAMAAQAADKLTLQLKWVTQAQFAGYYVAADKGFYEEENLEIEIKEYPFLSWMSQLGLSTEGGADGVTVLKQGFNVDPILQKQADCVSTMTYNEYWQIIDAGLSPDDLVVFKYEDEGVSTLEDGIYVLEESLEDPEMVDKLARFVKASMKGWKWAEENPEEAALIVLDNDASGAQTEKHQTRMMGEIAKLTAGSNGALDPADFDRTVATLLAGGSDPVITAVPEGAWTHAITDKALN